VEVPEIFKKDEVTTPETKDVKETKKAKVNIAARTKGLNTFWDKFKDSLIDLFKEEDDKEIK
jgi:cell division protein FtsA